MKSVSCPHCKRERFVKDNSMVARFGSEWRLTCKTCRLLRSIKQHQRAIATLQHQVVMRRVRGL